MFKLDTFRILIHYFTKSTKYGNLKYHYIDYIVQIVIFA